MKELLQEIDRFIKASKILRLATIELLVFTTLFVLYLCYTKQWIFVPLNLLLGCWMVKLICAITDDLEDAYADKIRMEFCIEQLGWDDEKA